MAYGDYETYNRDNGGRGYASQADRHMEVDIKCPNCMGEREIDINNMVLVCPYCDSKQILSEYEMEAYCRLKGITPPVKAAPPVYNNYVPNETIVMREYVPNPQPSYQPVSQPETNKTQKLLWIIGLFAAPYITIPLWFIVTKRIQTKFKVIVGVILLFIIISAAT
ncbi:hypothetical protein [Ruminococcus albus]|uniref:Uncharacterized protein n=1 Tax=Ruminococcus albus TaxID=1264 RepID=A0A1I1G1J2_RUMAL|nr:hypothetical protein [Ruminococcus albus]SFC05186.1 hypothetical protein SAMN02910406_01078 [Ruminococcus albus]